MKLLLDTHILLWAVADPSRLSQRATDMLLDPSNMCISSAACVWEIAIKHARNAGRPDDMPISGNTAILLAESAGFDVLHITPEHAAFVGDLPHFHRDPFDRLLIAQAKLEDHVLLTHDKTLAAYGDFVMVV